MPGNSPFHFVLFGFLRFLANRPRPDFDSTAKRPPTAGQMIQ
jgi:hypothetical protein